MMFRLLIYLYVFCANALFAQNRSECLPIDSIFIDGRLRATAPLDVIKAYFGQPSEVIFVEDGDSSGDLEAFLHFGNVSYRQLKNGRVQLDFIKWNEDARSLDFFGHTINNKTVLADLELLFPVAYAHRDVVELEKQNATVVRVFASCAPSDEQIFFFFKDYRLWQITFFYGED